MTSTVVILGSPRKGNSEAIAMAIANEANETVTRRSRLGLQLLYAGVALDRKSVV